MPRIRVEVEPLVIEVQGPLAVGTGFRRGLVHRTVERDGEGFVYIPASSLKGRTRRACEQLARELGLRVCRAPRPGAMCSAHEPLCLVCRVFGAPGRASDLRWRDARLPEDYRQGLRQTTANNRTVDHVYPRTQVQLSRARGVAAPDRLFTAEFALEYLCFESAITGWVQATPIAGDASAGGYELLLLLAGLRLVNTVGGSASRGAGKCAVALPDEIRVDGRAVRREDVLDSLVLLADYHKEADDDD